MKERSWIIISLALTVAIVSACASSQELENSATVIETVNQVDAHPSPQDEWRPAAVDMTIYGGGQVRTGPASSARLELLEGVVRLWADSLFTVRECTTRQDRLVTTLFLQEGRLWAHLTTSQPHRFIVETSSAVAAVRDTRFSVQVAPDQTTLVSVAEGEVVLTAQDESVVVTAGRQATVKPGQPPSPPESLSQAEHALWTTEGDMPELAALIIPTPTPIATATLRPTPTATPLPPTATSTPTSSPTLTPTPTATVPPTPEPPTPTTTPIPTPARVIPDGLYVIYAGTARQLKDGVTPYQESSLSRTERQIGMLDDRTMELAVSVTYDNQHWPNDDWLKRVDVYTGEFISDTADWPSEEQPTGATPLITVMGREVNAREFQSTYTLDLGDGWRESCQETTFRHPQVDFMLKWETTCDVFSPEGGRWGTETSSGQLIDTNLPLGAAE